LTVEQVLRGGVEGAGAEKGLLKEEAVERKEGEEDLGLSGFEQPRDVCLESLERILDVLAEGVSGVDAVAQQVLQR